MGSIPISSCVVRGQRGLRRADFVAPPRTGSDGDRNSLYGFDARGREPGGACSGISVEFATIMLDA